MNYNLNHMTDAQLVFLFEHCQTVKVLVAVWEELDKRMKLDLVCTAC